MMICLDYKATQKPWDLCGLGAPGISFRRLKSYEVIKINAPKKHTDQIGECLTLGH